MSWQTFEVNIQKYTESVYIHLLTVRKLSLILLKDDMPAESILITFQERSESELKLRLNVLNRRV
jgi:hypothetical protein